MLALCLAASGCAVHDPAKAGAPDQSGHGVPAPTIAVTDPKPYEVIQRDAQDGANVLVGGASDVSTASAPLDDNWGLDSTAHGTIDWFVRCYNAGGETDGYVQAVLQ